MGKRGRKVQGEGRGVESMSHVIQPRRLHSKSFTVASVVAKTMMEDWLACIVAQINGSSLRWGKLSGQQQWNCLSIPITLKREVRFSD